MYSVSQKNRCPFYYASAHNRLGGALMSDRPSVRLSGVSLCTLISRAAISHYLVDAFQRKLATNMHHVSGNCWKGFQGQRSAVKVIARWNVLFERTDTSTYDGGMWIDDVASRFTSFLYNSGNSCCDVTTLSVTCSWEFCALLIGLARGCRGAGPPLRAT